MQMSDDEIRASMRKAKDPAAQVRILAELNDVNEGEIRAKLEELGVDVPKQRHRRVTFDTIRAERLLQEGKTDREAAEMLGCRKETLADWRRSMGIPSKSHRKKRPDTIPAGTAGAPTVPPNTGTRAPEEAPRPAKRKKAAPGLAPAVPASGEPGTMTAARMAEIFAALAQWHPDVIVTYCNQDIERVELVSTYEGTGEPVLRVRIE